ncbi:hypothetical protein EZS27_018430 [termite gut metagenome]|uniref:Carboxymuconolactone decarboxylase-like domain-containing protein n=1 Tax=termite gut metagenome TaxID=433724 RepID=A0A5J4RHZ6_9ZZZZ
MCINYSNAQSTDNNSLNQKQQKIVTIAANTAVGNLEQLRQELNAGLDAGLTVNEINEIIVQMYAYSGFPRSLQGLNTFMAVLNERKARGITDERGKEASPVTDKGDKYARGKKTLEMLTRRVEKEPIGVNAFSPEIDIFLKEHLFADIFDRDVLSYADRELATISALTAISGVTPMLQTHINMGKNTGITEAQIQEIADIVEATEPTIFLKGNRGSADWFTGTVYVQPLVNPDEMGGLYAVGSVTFEPGGKTHWHTHPIGQTLLVIEGKGYYQERGKSARLLCKGDVVVIPKDVEHWHGATHDNRFVQLPSQT